MMKIIKLIICLLAGLVVAGLGLGVFFLAVFAAPLLIAILIGLAVGGIAFLVWMDVTSSDDPP